MHCCWIIIIYSGAGVCILWQYYEEVTLHWIAVRQWLHGHIRGVEQEIFQGS